MDGGQRMGPYLDRGRTLAYGGTLARGGTLAYGCALDCGRGGALMLVAIA